MKTLQIYVSGKVQGVFFREYTLRSAMDLKINGWVRNLKDGRVEIVVQASSEKLNEFVKKIAKGPESAEVINLETRELIHSETFKEFVIMETA